MHAQIHGDPLFDRQFDHQGESFLIRWEDEDTWARIPGLALERKEPSAQGNHWTWWKVKRFLCKVWGPDRVMQLIYAVQFRELCWEMLETEQTPKEHPRRQRIAISL